MRTFYIFKIKRELTILTKETPYNLYHTIDSLYYLDNFNMGVSNKLYYNLFDTLDINYLNKRINNLFKDNRYYTFKDNIHYLNNKYKPENSTLKVFRTHMLLKTDTINPALLINYLMTDNLFVCDFQNKDYFWLNEFVR